jgi:Ca-activated chloride channel family protein
MRNHRSWLLLAALVLGLLPVFASCQPEQGTPRSSDALPKPDPNIVDLLFTYGSEKEGWIKDCTAAFNQSGAKVGARTIRVTAVPMGSGECIDELLTEKRKAHLSSPASNAFIVLGNAEARAKGGKELFGKTKNLVLSPVVIAMWKPMAEALGWPSKPVGWKDLKALAESKDGWAALKYPQWGHFKLGHTHPAFSNSGLITVLAEVYAATGKTEGLTVDDVNRPETAQFMEGIEQAVVHYGSSTGFFGKKMFTNGPEYLSAAVLYENMVIESYDPKYSLPFPVVAVYPKEGTFWSDHPVGVVQRDWVTAEHKEAAEKYIDFLLAKPQQEKALKSGFRPGLESIALAAPIDKEHGVDPAEPKVELPPPPAEVIGAALKLWKGHKKKTQIVVVFDTSGSMRIGGRMSNAKLGAKQLLNMLGEGDDVSILAFSTELNWVEKGINAGKEHDKLTRQIDSFIPAGETALYDAVEAGYRYLQDNPKPGLISAVVVLTDGEDNKSKLKLDDLLKKVKIDYERKPIRVFTIAYGDEAKIDVLKKIADATEAKAYEGTPDNIRTVFLDIATFF